jgi:signal transduction histidine kinase
MITELSRETTINIKFEVNGFWHHPLHKADIALFRIAQEALRNSLRHSQATQVLVSIDFMQDKAKLIVSDDGIGFELPKALCEFASQGRLGLIGMQERVRLLNGNLSVESEVGKGTKVVVEVARGTSMLCDNNAGPGSDFVI